MSKHAYSITITPNMLFRAVAKRYAEQIAAHYGKAVADVTEAEVDAWLSRVPAGADIVKRCGR